MNLSAFRCLLYSCAARISTRNTLPPSGLSSTQIRPRCASMMVLQIAKPNPTPWPAVLLASAQDLMKLQKHLLFVIVRNSIPAVRHRNGGGGTDDA